jgi:hypothetical protein
METGPGNASRNVKIAAEADFAVLWRTYRQWSSERLLPSEAGQTAIPASYEQLEWFRKALRQFTCQYFAELVSVEFLMMIIERSIQVATLFGSSEEGAEDRFDVLAYSFVWGGVSSFVSHSSMQEHTRTALRTAHVGVD